MTTTPTRAPVDLLLSGAIGFALVAAVLGAGYINGVAKRPPVAYVSGTVSMSGGTATIAQRPAAKWDEHTQIVAGRRLPVIVENKRVFDLFKRPASIPPTLVGETPKPRMGIIVLGLGFNSKSSLAALDMLPPEAAIGLSPQAPYATDMFGAARVKGRELWVHAPSTSRIAGRDEGAQSLRIRVPASENIDNLHMALGSLTHYAGVVFSPYSSVSTSADDMDPVMQELGQRGLGFGRLDPVLSLTTEQQAAKNNVPLLPPAQSISEAPFPAAVRQSLDKTLQLAKDNGGALAVITEPNPVVVKALAEWLRLHSGKDIVIVPPSALAAE